MSLEIIIKGGMKSGKTWAAVIIMEALERELGVGVAVEDPDYSLKLAAEMLGKLRLGAAVHPLKGRRVVLRTKQELRINKSAGEESP